VDSDKWDETAVVPASCPLTSSPMLVARTTENQRTKMDESLRASALDAKSICFSPNPQHWYINAPLVSSDQLQQELEEATEGVLDGFWVNKRETGDGRIEVED
jgi:hypothetical protein